MLQFSNLNSVRVMEPETILKNGASPKSQMSKGIFLLLLFFLFPHISSLAQQYKEYFDGCDVGYNLAEQKRYDEAISILIKTTKVHAPNNVNMAWYTLGDVYYKLKKYNDAINSLNTLLDLAAHSGGACTMQTWQYNDIWYCIPKDKFRWAQGTLGLCYAKIGNDEQALSHYNAAISVDAASYLFLNRGELYERQGKMQEAISDFVQLIMDKQYDGTWREPLIKKVIEFYESNKNNAELYKFLKDVPNKNAEEYNKLAYTSFQLNKLEEANQYYNEAIRLQPSLSVDVVAREASQKYVADNSSNNTTRNVTKEVTSHSQVLTRESLKKKLDQSSFDDNKSKAEQGDMNAQFELGFRYAYGIGVQKNLTEAFRWYLKSAEQGNGYAQSQVSKYYNEGIGTTQDYEKTAFWGNKALEQDNDWMQYYIGYCNMEYYHRPGTAMVWFKKSAEQGNPDAQQALEAIGAGIGAGIGILGSIVKSTVDALNAPPSSGGSYSSESGSSDIDPDKVDIPEISEIEKRYYKSPVPFSNDWKKSIKWKDGTKSYITIYNDNYATSNFEYYKSEADAIKAEYVKKKYDKVRTIGKGTHSFKANPDE